MNNNTQRPERVTLSDALLTGLHEAGWFARADLDPDLLGGIIRDAADIAGEWASAREQALREEIAEQIETDCEADEPPCYGCWNAARIARGE